MGNSLAAQHRRCLVDDCRRLVGPRGARGLCPPHYKRFVRYGDPLGQSERVLRGDNGRPAVERMLERVDFDGPGGCWLYPTRRKDGYASVATDERRPNSATHYTEAMVHHVMFWLVHGRCAVGELDHTCYRRNCIRIDHLEEATRGENLARGNERRRRERAAYRLLEELHPELVASL